MQDSKSTEKRGQRGFQQTGGLLSGRIRRAGESRGFSEIRLLTHWADVVGEEIAAIARPVKVGYGRRGLGATLTLLTKGAHAPILQMQLPRIRERVNSVYGYAAISRIHVTQTSPAGFAEKAEPFTPPEPALSETETAQLRQSVASVADEGLKSALERLGQNVMTRTKSRKEPK